MVTRAGEEGKPMLSPAPSGVEAPMDEYQRQRRAGDTTPGQWALDDGLHPQPGRQPVKNTRLPFLQLVCRCDGEAHSRPFRGQQWQMGLDWKRNSEEEKGRH